MKIASHFELEGTEVEKKAFLKRAPQLFKSSLKGLKHYIETSDLHHMMEVTHY